MKDCKCFDESRICPLKKDVCCRYCESKKDGTVCNGDIDQGCGEWELGFCKNEEKESE